jgi:SPP1 family predicted phage head-tail adaptor
MIPAGRRNKLITIQELAQTTTDGGEITEAPVTVCTCWAAIDPLTAREEWLARQSQATTTHKITILYRSGITCRMRASWGGRLFHFEAVMNVAEENREMVILATEVTP